MMYPEHALYFCLLCVRLYGTVADLRFGEGGGVLGKGLCVPKARSARGGPGYAPAWEMFEI